MVKKYFGSIIIFAAYFFSFLFFSIFAAFSGISNIETLAANLTECASVNSETSSVNLNMFNVEENIQASKMMEESRKCYNQNISNLFQDKYMYRVVFDSSNDTYFYFDDSARFSSMFFATTGPHKNAKNENIDGWFELKMAFEKEPSYNWGTIATFINLRESTAKRIIEGEGGVYSLDAVKDKIMAGWYLNINFNNKDDKSILLVQVNNIILEEGFDDYYHSLFGDYITMYAYGIKNCSNYSINMDFGSSVKQTSRILQEVKTLCSSEQYRASFNTRNLIDDAKFLTERNKIIDYINGDRIFIGDAVYTLFAILFVIGMSFPAFLKRVRHKVILPCFLAFCVWYVTSKYLFTLFLPSVFTSQIMGIFTVVIFALAISILFGPHIIYSKKRFIKI